MQKQRARKRLTRQEIKEDKLLIWTSRTLEYLQDNLVAIVGGAVGVVVLILLGYGYQAYQTSVEQDSITALAGLDRIVATRNSTAIIAKADQIIASAGGLAVDRAKLEKADALRTTGDYTQAKPLYMDILGDLEGVNGYRAVVGYADCLGAESRYGEAGRVLASWADDNISNGLAAHALMEAAVNYELAREFAAARTALQRVVDNFDRSAVTGVARTRLKMLDGAVAAVAQ